MPDTVTITRLHDSLSFHLTATAREIERRVEDGLRSFGLTRTGWCILLCLAEEGLTRPSDISSFLSIDRAGTSRALRGLEEKGLIARQTGDDDRRSTDVMLTQHGAQTVRDAAPLCEANLTHFAGKLDAKERETLMIMLDKLRS